MRRALQSKWHCVLAVAGVLVAALLILPAQANCADPASSNTADPSGNSVEMFAGIQQGIISVKVILKDSTQCRILIENKTDKPLSVKLPAAFGATPVLAQAAAGGAAKAPQPVGGGGGGGMGGMGGGGMGMMNLLPEKVGQIKATTVCLEHGKGEPYAKIPYEIRPIETVTAKPEVQELCRALGDGINQRVAQIVAWHFNNNMTWEQLAAKQYRFANGGGTPYFSSDEIKAAMALSVVISRRAIDRRQAAVSTTPSASTSSPSVAPN